MNVDLKKLTENLAGMLGLPEGMQIEGVINSKITADGQLEKTIGIDGRTEITNLYITGGPLGDKPLRQPSITLMQNAIIDIPNDKMTVHKINVESNFAEMFLAGTVTELKKARNLNFKIFLKLDIEKLTQNLQGIVSLPQGLSINGKIATEIKAKGSIVDGLKLDGTTILDSINATGGPLKDNTISDLDLKLLHRLEYKITEDSVNIEKMDIESEFLKMESKGGIASLSKEMNINYELSMKMDLDKITEEFAGMFPVDINMSGEGIVDLDINGKLTAQENENIYEQMNLNGNMSMEKIIYDAYEIKDFKAGFVLDDGFFTTKDFSFKLNDGPGTVSASANLREAKPPLIFDMQLSDVNINQNMDILAYFVPVLAAPEGKLSGQLNMQFKAKGNGLNWQDDLSKSLNGEGEIEIKDGYIKGGKVTSKILKALGGRGEYEFDKITTRFVIADSKISNDDISVNGKEFDIGLSGWTSFDGRIEYSADAEALSRHVGRDARKILSALSQGSNLPIVVTGTINKPELSFKWPKPQEIGSILQGILGSSGDSRPQTESSGSQEKTETGKIEKETQPVKKKEEDTVEDVVEKLLKGFFK
jgi:hypothetical protein